MRLTRELPRWRWLAVIAIFAMVAAACGAGDDGETDPYDGLKLKQRHLPKLQLQILLQIQPLQPSRLRLPALPTSWRFSATQQLTNPWAYYDTEADVWNQYVLAPAIPYLYTLSFPNYTLIPSMASDVEPPIGAADGDNWVIDVSVQDGLQWSDGSPLNANDVAFTFNAMKDLNMGGNFLASYPLAADDDPETADVDESADGILSIEALDDLTVRYTWSSQPGLGPVAIWCCTGSDLLAGLLGSARRGRWRSCRSLRRLWRGSTFRWSDGL